MNLFLPSCRDLFINFEWFLFNWKLLQSTGSEPGHIWTGIVLDPNKKENKKKTTQWLLEGIHPFPLGIVPQPTASARPLHPGALFCLRLLANFSLAAAGGRDPQLAAPRWGLTPQVGSVFSGVPSGVGNLACWGLLEGLASGASVALRQNAKHVGAVRSIFKWSWAAAFSFLRRQGLEFRATHWETLSWHKP